MGIIAYNEIDGDLSKDIEVIKNEVDTSTPGIYKVKYRVINSLSVISYKDRYISIYNIITNNSQKNT